MKVTYITSEDWCGLYLGEKLVWETHSLPGWAALELLNLEGVIDLTTIDVDPDWLEEHELPDSLSSISDLLSHAE